MVLDVRFFLRFTSWFWGTDMIFLTVLDWQHCIYISLSYCEVPSLKALGTSIQIHIYPGRLTECQSFRGNFSNNQILLLNLSSYTSVSQ